MTPKSRIGRRRPQLSRIRLIERMQVTTTKAP